MKNTLRYSCFILLSAALSIPAFGQEAAATANPLLAGEKAVYNHISQTVVAAAEKMPEENYSFKPTPEVRSFGQIVGHIADTQRMFCATASGQTPASTESIEKTRTSKADLVQALKGAIDYCNQAYNGMTDAQATQMVKMMGYSFPKLTVMSINTAHTDEHYGNMVTYMRMKNIVPPSSEPPGGGK